MADVSEASGSSLFLGDPSFFLEVDAHPATLAKGLLHDRNHVDGETRLRIWEATMDVPTDPSQAILIHDIQEMFGDRPQVNVVLGLRHLADLGMIQEIPLKPGETGLDRRFHRTESRGWKLVRSIIDFAHSER